MRLTHFNSIKVRLKLLTTATTEQAPTFQFHKGTIKTLYRVGIRPMMQNFNSIKVRLKLNS